MNIDTNEVKDLVNGLRGSKKFRNTNPFSSGIMDMFCDAMIDRIEIYEEEEIEDMARQFGKGLK